MIRKQRSTFTKAFRAAHGDFSKIQDQVRPTLVGLSVRIDDSHTNKEHTLKNRNINNYEFYKQPTQSFCWR